MSGFEMSGLEPTLTTDGKFQSKTGINYTYNFFYEKKFFNEDYIESKRTWMVNNWHLSLVFAFAYVVCIFSAQKYMKTRERFELRKPLIVWNFILAVFSAAGAIRVWPEFIDTIRVKGLDHSFCSEDYTHGVTGSWSWLFILSKVPELIDTAFIVARKQKLIFLHWYHHTTVLVYCWYSAREFAASGRWFVLMNLTVHAFMYSYYFLRAMRVKIPKWVNIAITTGQLSQMVFGIYVNCQAYLKKSRNEPCQISEDNIRWSFLMYFSYFILFFHFFYKTYIQVKPKTSYVNGNGKVANGHHHYHLTTNGHHHDTTVTNGHANGNGHHANGNGYATHDQNNNKSHKYE
jgi:hypothetical protein